MDMIQARFRHIHPNCVPVYLMIHIMKMYDPFSAFFNIKMQQADDILLWERDGPLYPTSYSITWLLMAW